MLRTERLVLRPIEPDLDAESLHRGYVDVDAIRWWHQPAPGSLEETRQRLVELASSRGQLAICIDGPDAPAIGHTGWLTRGEGRRHGVGYFLLPEHWGRGIAHEASSAALRDPLLLPGT